MSITLKLKAVIVCDRDDSKSEGMCCCAFCEYSDNAESMSLEKFAKSAAEYFENKGWRLSGSICPNCQDVPRISPEEIVKSLF